jgi:hypothetical protein
MQARYVRIANRAGNFLLQGEMRQRVPGKAVKTFGQLSTVHGPQTFFNLVDELNEILVVGVDQVVSNAHLHLPFQAHEISPVVVAESAEVTALAWRNPLSTCTIRITVRMTEVRRSEYHCQWLVSVHCPAVATQLRPLRLAA